MSNQDQNIGEWEAWTYPDDFNPHIYIEGKMPSNDGNLIYSLRVADVQGFNSEQLIIELSPDQIYQNGSKLTQVQSFSTPTEFKSFDSVLIKTPSVDHVAMIPIDKRSR